MMNDARMVPGQFATFRRDNLRKKGVGALPAPANGHGVLEPVALSFAGDAKVGDEPQHVSVLLKDEAQISRAKPRRQFLVSTGLQVEGRPADDLEHVGGGGLLL